MKILYLSLQKASSWDKIPESSFFNLLIYTQIDSKKSGINQTLIFSKVKTVFELFNKAAIVTIKKEVSDNLEHHWN